MTMYVGHANTELKRQRMEHAAHLGICVFCEEHLGTIHTEPILYRNDSWTVTPNASPYKGLEHHYLVLARTHVEDFTALSTDAVAHLHDAVSWLVSETKTSGYSLLFRNGEPCMTGGSIRHLHGHFIVGDASADDPEEARISVSTKVAYKRME
jgi:diadenosine tetraphosphate (Ap4A) HIT family hydrolase